MRPTLSNPTERDLAWDRRRQEEARRCPNCPTQEDGYPPGLDYKFAFGGDDEGGGMTTAYQCPKCKEIVVD